MDAQMHCSGNAGLYLPQDRAVKVQHEEVSTSLPPSQRWQASPVRQPLLGDAVFETTASAMTLPATTVKEDFHGVEFPDCMHDKVALEPVPRQGSIVHHHHHDAGQQCMRTPVASGPIAAVAWDHPLLLTTSPLPRHESTRHRDNIPQLPKETLAISPAVESFTRQAGQLQHSHTENSTLEQGVYREHFPMPILSDKESLDPSQQTISIAVGDLATGLTFPQNPPCPPSSAAPTDRILALNIIHSPSSQAVAGAISNDVMQKAALVAPSTLLGLSAPASSESSMKTDHTDAMVTCESVTLGNELMPIRHSTSASFPNSSKSSRLNLDQQWAEMMAVVQTGLTEMLVNSPGSKASCQIQGSHDWAGSGNLTMASPLDCPLLSPLGLREVVAKAASSFTEPEPAGDQFHNVLHHPTNDGKLTPELVLGTKVGPGMHNLEPTSMGARSHVQEAEPAQIPNVNDTLAELSSCYEYAEEQLTRQQRPLVESKASRLSPDESLTASRLEEWMRSLEAARARALADPAIRKGIAGSVTSPSQSPLSPGNANQSGYSNASACVNMLPVSSVRNPLRFADVAHRLRPCASLKEALGLTGKGQGSDRSTQGSSQGSLRKRWQTQFESVRMWKMGALEGGFYSKHRTTSSIDLQGASAAPSSASYPKLRKFRSSSRAVTIESLSRASSCTYSSSRSDSTLSTVASEKLADSPISSSRRSQTPPWALEFTLPVSEQPQRSGSCYSLRDRGSIPRIRRKRARSKTESSASKSFTEDCNNPERLENRTDLSRAASDNTHELRSHLSKTLSRLRKRWRTE